MSIVRRRTRTFHKVLGRARPVVRMMARSLAEQDLDLADDLEQEGLIAIFEIPTYRMVRARRKVRYATGCATRAMHRYLSRGDRWSTVPDRGEIVGWSVQRVRTGGTRGRRGAR